MKKAFCANCRGPLKFQPGAEVAKCDYCGHQQPVGRRRGVAVSGGGKSVAPKIILAITVVAVGAGIALPIWLTSRTLDTVSKTVNKTTAKNKQVYTPADFDKAPNGQWFSLDVTGMKGALDTFDPIANFDWFVSVAKEWSPDAELDRYGFALGHLSATTATVDLLRKGTIDIRFVSKARRAAADKLAEVSEETVPTKFRIWIRGGEVHAMKSLDRGQPAPAGQGMPATLPVLTCSTAQVLDAAQKSKRLPTRPYYNARLYVAAKGWVWSVSADGGHATVAPDVCE